jgi:competence protein ComEA
VAELSRSQLLVYGAVAVALLLIGARAIRAEGSGGGLPTSLGAEAPSIELTGGDLVVDVGGAIRRPGVYRLPDGSRVIDALRRAGGPSPDEELVGLNRAALLTDGQQVVVPERGTGGGTGIAAATEGPIGIGTASVADLETIDGIGPVTAQKIVEYRDSQGGLSSVEQLDEVSGIGPATMESLRARLQP